MIMVEDCEASASGGSSPTRPRGRPSVETAAQIDREILDAALDQFLTYGYGETSMAMIIKAACVSKTTLYARYATKADLFRAIIRRTAEEVHGATHKGMDPLTMDLVEGLRSFGRNALKISQMPIWVNHERLIYSEGPRFPELGQSVLERVDLAVDEVRSFIVSCGERDGVPCRDPLRVARTYMMAIRGFLTECAFSMRPFDGERGEAFIVDLVDTLVLGRSEW